MDKKPFKSRINHLENNGAGVLSLRVIDSVNNANLSKFLDFPSFLNLISVNERYQSALAPTDKDVLSEETKSLNVQRKYLFWKLYDFSKGLIKSPDTKMAEAASTIFRILNLYGRSFVHRKLVDQAISYIRIINELLKPENAEALTTMGILESVTLLDNVQKEYETQYFALGKLTSENDVPSKLRKEMDNALKLLYDTVRIEAVITKDTKTIALFNNLMLRLAEVEISYPKKKSDDADNKENPLKKNG